MPVQPVTTSEVRTAHHGTNPYLPGVLDALVTLGYRTLECRPRGEPPAAVASVPSFVSRMVLTPAR